MKIRTIFLACLVPLLASCAKQAAKKPQTGKPGSVRPAHRWGLMDSAREARQKQDKAVERQDKLLEGLSGKRE